MVQVLKEEVRRRILLAAEEVFYKEDYRSAKLQEIADKAGIPVSLIYSYFKNKSVLFDSLVEPIYFNFGAALEEEESAEGSAMERFEEVGEKYLYELLRCHKRLVILMDKSSGTRHFKAKQDMICQLQSHIEIGLKRNAKEEYDPMLAHILASNFTEGLLEVARHYQGERWSRRMLKVIIQCYYKGVDSL